MRFVAPESIKQDVLKDQVEEALREAPCTPKEVVEWDGREAI